MSALVPSAYEIIMISSPLPPKLFFFFAFFLVLPIFFLYELTTSRIILWTGEKIKGLENQEWDEERERGMLRSQFSISSGGGVGKEF